MSQKSDKASTSPNGPALTANQVRSGERFLTKPQFAALLQVSERTLDRWLLDGDLPPETRLTIGGCVRFRPVALEQWISSRQNGKAD